jgi:hypothetical protein
MRVAAKVHFPVFLLLQDIHSCLRIEQYFVCDLAVGRPNSFTGRMDRHNMES